MGHLLVLALFSCAAQLIPNPGFESGLDGWGDLWTREEHVGRLSLETAETHGGTHAARVEHRGERDWSFDPRAELAVQHGDVFVLQVWVKLQGTGSTTLCAVTRDSAGEVLEWIYAPRSTSQTQDWRLLRSRFVVPANVAHVQPRLIGDGPATIWLDDFMLEREGNVMEQRNANLPEELTVENALISVTLRTEDGTFAVRDKRTGTTWEQRGLTPEMLLQDAEVQGSQIQMTLLHATSGLDIQATLELENAEPECTLELLGSGELPGAVKFPQPFVTEPGTYLVVPMNEGISYPVDDPSIGPMRLIAYGGHGICMPFWGVTDGEQAQMAILETPDDAAIRISRVDETLCIAPEWEPQRGAFGYARRVRYVFLDQGGHVAMCKRYRAYAEQTGLLTTLAQKRDAIPAVDALIGAVNVWCWDREALPLVREMQSLGIERILWSHRRSPEVIREMNQMGVLTSRYDIYQDVMDPAIFPQLGGVHPDWPTEAWPQDLMIRADGAWARGWEVSGKNGRRYPCGVLCDKQAPDYARKRIAEELKTHPYACRFIDTTTASPWRECYHPDHPMTRSESKHWKMELLRVVSEEMQLVTGCETGHDAAVPYVHYFEGMLSLGPYRVPEAGRNMIQPWDEVPERVATFQVGHAYRLPLWELVYHDCVVSQWYWGDYNNKLPALWDKRDLFNLLYGTPPMFMFNREIWQRHKQRFVQSYQNVCPVVREVGYAEMTDHRFLTEDRRVQQTTFSNGISITVNFGEDPHPEDGTEVTPMGFIVQK